MKRVIVLALVIVVAAGATAAALAKPSATGSASAAQAVSCKSTLTIPFVTPLTGGAGFIGTEQATWAKYAAKTLPSHYGLKIKLVFGDTPVEQGPAPALALAQKYIADKSVVAILGPSTSGNAGASTKVYTQAGLVQLSPSATHTELTIGTPAVPYIGSPGFFRNVPGDYIQGPTDARFMINKLHVKKVVIIDFQEPYSVGLADIVESTLKKAGVSVTRLSAPNTTTDYSAYVTKVPNDADVVFFPTQKPPDIQTFGQQLLEQGKKAKLFGGDGSNDPAHFTIAGSYVSNFAPDITGIPADAAIVAGWQKDNPGKVVGSFGPPSYGAVQILLEAIKKACIKGHGSIQQRHDVIRNMKKVRIPNFILGGTFRFSTKTNDPLNAKFYIFQIQSNGKYKLVG